MSYYLAELHRAVRAENERASADASGNSLTARVAGAVGDSTVARIPELQRALKADPRAIGAVLRELGFGRRRIWSGDDYALTCWFRDRAAQTS